MPSASRRGLAQAADAGPHTGALSRRSTPARRWWLIPAGAVIPLCREHGPPPGRAGKTHRRRCQPPRGLRQRWRRLSPGRCRSPRGLFLGGPAAGDDPRPAHAERRGLVPERIEHLGERSVHSFVCALVLVPPCPVEGQQVVGSPGHHDLPRPSGSWPWGDGQAHPTESVQRTVLSAVMQDEPGVGQCPGYAPRAGRGDRWRAVGARSHPRTGTPPPPVPPSPRGPAAGRGPAVRHPGSRPQRGRARSAEVGSQTQCSP